jgi:hypothetical protein
LKGFRKFLAGEIFARECGFEKRKKEERIASRLLPQLHADKNVCSLRKHKKSSLQNADCDKQRESALF